jgi:hypothetical protein
MAESDLGSFAVAPEASLAIAQDEDTEIDRPTVTRSSAYNNWSADDPVELCSRKWLGILY